MSIFKKQQEAPKRERASVSARTPDGAISIIGSGMKVVGDVTTEGTVRIEGTVEGTVRAAVAVVLGKGGTIEGDIITKDALIGGTVRGSIAAENRLELQSTSVVSGILRAPAEHLKLEEGGRFAGQIQMGDEGNPAQDGQVGDGRSLRMGDASRGTAEPETRDGTRASENDEGVVAEAEKRTPREGSRATV